MMSPTARTLQHLRDEGYVAGVVEQTIRGKGIIFKRDFIGCIDVIAFKSERCFPVSGLADWQNVETIGIQACAGTDHAKRRAKAMALPDLKKWLECGHRFEVWSWRKGGARGKRKLWTLRREPVHLSDFAHAVAPQPETEAK